MKNKHIQRIIFVGGLFVAFAVGANAQFNSGSTGADGALDLSTMTCPANVCEIQLPESGILNYTTVNVPAGKTLKFKSNSRNTPVILLAQGNVTIGGTISIDAFDRIPGPGGFYGGQSNFPGFGPGGGQVLSGSEGGRWVGPLSLVPIIGGSGGAGVRQFSSGPGGGGGGAIVIASSTSISQAGNLDARGYAQDYLLGRGAGGAIRLVSNTLNVSGGLRACLTNGNAIGPWCGVVRLEATSLSFTGNSQPAATLSPINPDIVSSSQPQLTIQSIGGYAVPAYAGTRFDTIDVLLPNQIQDPVNVVVNAANIPTGTQVNIGFVSGSTTGATTPCNLAGTLSGSSCTATISNLNRTAVTYLLATAAFTPPGSLAQFNPKGPNHVAKIRLEAAMGVKPKYVFLDSSGKMIDTTKIRREFLQYFGI